jgi:restriction system protein
MAMTRADRIEQILQNNGGRLRIGSIWKKLADLEGDDSLNQAAVSATIRQDNTVRDARGDTPRFKYYGDGNEVYGYASLLTTHTEGFSAEQIVEQYDTAIPDIISQVNNQVKQKLRDAISELSWQEFESNFMRQILEMLGFINVEVTQPIKDGGIDGKCSYRRGLVESEAYVSAKHWKQNNVGPDEINRLRGLKGVQDAAIVFTSANFTPKAKTVAQPGQNQRSIVLIDGETIVNTCFETGIGVKPFELPTVYRFVGLTGDEDER